MPRARLHPTDRRLPSFMMLPIMALPIVLALPLAACGDVDRAKAVRSDGEHEPRHVRTAPAVSRVLPTTVTATGTLGAEEQVVLGFKVAGRLAEIPVDLGSRVDRGATLARLAPVDFELRVRQAEAAHDQARSRLGLAVGGRADDRGAGGSERSSAAGMSGSSGTGRAAEASESQIDPEQTSLVRQAGAVRDEARLRHERTRSLWDQKLVSQAEIDAADAELKVADARYQDALEEVYNRIGVLAQRRSELDLARQQLADSALAAPFGGAVRERHASIGQYVPAGQPIVTLVRLHPLRLRLAVPERDAAGLRAGQEVRVAVEGDPKAHLGRVARLSPAIEEGSRTLRIEADVPNEDGALRPGAFATATIFTSSGQPATLVPLASIVTFAGLEKVFVVSGGKAVETRVRSGRREGPDVEILEGLTPGQVVVVEPGNLVGGQSVAAAAPSSPS